MVSIARTEPTRVLLSEVAARIQTALFSRSEPAYYDRILLLVTLTLMAFGLILVFSASMPEAAKNFNNPYHYLIRHSVYLLLSFICAAVVLHVPSERWHQGSFLLLLGALVLLVLVLAIGRKVNGSTRWLSLGPINVQAAEPAKLFFFCYLASYLVRRYDQVREQVWGFAKPLGVFGLIAIMLLAQPDLGTVVVMLVTTMGMLFLAGARLWQFITLVVGAFSLVGLAIWLEPYRMKRVTSFLDPWQDPFGSGYQLTQSLMAFGRGHLWGEGLGNSIQKLAYLPEAHTDFVIAVIAEELGLVGVMVVIALLGVLVSRAMLIGSRALHQNHSFSGYLAYGIGIWICFQTVVNIGVCAGMLPTKGLTLPLISYGGSSLIIMSMAIALLLRIDHELRMDNIQACSGGKR